MIKLVKKMLLFILPALYIIVINFVFVQSTPYNHDYNFKKQQLLKQADSIQTLLIGSSTVNWGIDPAPFEYKAFNFGNSAEDLVYDFKLLNRWGDSLPNLKVVVLGIEYGWLFYTQTKRSDLPLYPFWRCYDVSIPFNHYAKGITINPIPLIKGFSNKLHGITHVYTSDRISELGLEKPFGRLSDLAANNGWENLEQNAKNAVQSMGTTNLSVQEEYFPQNKKAVLQIIDWCQRRNIPLIICSTPLWKDQFYMYQETKFYHESRSFLHSLPHEYANVYYYDFADDSDFTLEDFMNFDHVGGSGALKMGQKLNNIVNQLL